jgi:hypothetical protein
MEVSEWSGEPLEPGAAAEMTVTLPDGVRRRIKIRADEAKTFADKGRDATSFWSKVRGRLSWKLSVPAVLLLLLGGLFLPALTKQWSDRASANAIRSQAAVDLSTAYAVPEFDGLDEFDPRQSTKPLDPDHPTGRDYTKSYLEWQSLSSNVTATMYLYFFGVDSPLYDEWVQFQSALGSYEDLGCMCREDHWNDDVERITAYIGRYSKSLLPNTPTSDQLSDGLTHCGPGQTPLAGRWNCEAYMAWVAYDFSFGRNYLLKLLRSAKPKGYSQGLNDFVSDVFAPLHS